MQTKPLHCTSVHVTVIDQNQPCKCSHISWTKALQLSTQEENTFNYPWMHSLPIYIKLYNLPDLVNISITSLERASGIELHCKCRSKKLTCKTHPSGLLKRMYLWCTEVWQPVIRLAHSSAQQKKCKKTLINILGYFYKWIWDKHSALSIPLIASSYSQFKNNQGRV